MAAKLTPDCVCSSSKVSKFLDTKEEVNAIVSYAKEHKTCGSEKVYGRWEMGKIVIQAPFQYIQKVFLNGIAQLFLVVRITSLAKRCTVAAANKTQYLQELRFQWHFNKAYLASARNCHDSSTAPFFTQKSVVVPKDSIYKKMAFNNSRGEKRIRFFHKQVCDGMTHRFVELYLRSKNKVRDPILLMKAITHVFQNGANTQSAFLNNFVQSPTIKTKAAMARFLNKDLQSPSRVNKLNKLPVGAYEVGLVQKGWNQEHLLGHRIAYIKLSSNQGFIFDPYYGTCILDGKDQAAKITAYAFDKDFYPNTEWLYFDRTTL